MLPNPDIMRTRSPPSPSSNKPLYALLDLILIAPSAIISVCLRKDYQQSIPWLLSSLSLIIAIADDGYVVDFINVNL